MKHWKKKASALIKPGQDAANTQILRYYPPPTKGQKNEVERQLVLLLKLLGISTVCQFFTYLG